MKAGKLICFILCLCYLLAPLQIYSQKTNAAKDSSIHYIKIDALPIPPGGQKAFSDYVIHRIKWPKDKIGSGTILLRIKIKKDGHAEDIFIKKDEVGDSIAQQIIRIIMDSANVWQPAKRLGEGVQTLVLFPFVFSQDHKNESAETDTIIRCVHPDALPVPRGGKTYFVSYIKPDMHLPNECYREGCSVHVELTITKDGVPCNFKMSNDSLAYSVTREKIIQTIKSEGLWQPAMFNGAPVNARTSITVVFFVKQ